MGKRLTDRVDVVASAPETPFSAKIGGSVDRVGCLAMRVCVVGLALLCIKRREREVAPGISNGMLGA